MNSNKTFSVMADEVERALQDLRDAEQMVKDAEETLAARKKHVEVCRSDFNTARDDLFQEYPELAPEAQAPLAAPLADNALPAQPKPVMSPQGPVVFRERDDFDSPFGGGE